MICNAKEGTRLSSVGGDGNSGLSGSRTTVAKDRAWTETRDSRLGYGCVDYGRCGEKEKRANRPNIDILWNTEHG